jgi:hypothetical protein
MVGAGHTVFFFGFAVILTRLFTAIRSLLIGFDGCEAGRRAHLRCSGPPINGGKSETSFLVGFQNGIGLNRITRQLLSHSSGIGVSRAPPIPMYSVI